MNDTPLFHINDLQGHLEEMRRIVAAMSQQSSETGTLTIRGPWKPGQSQLVDLEGQIVEIEYSDPGRPAEPWEPEYSPIYVVTKPAREYKIILTVKRNDQ